MARLQIYLVNMEYPPISGPGIWRILGFSRHLDALGHHVRVICSDRSSWHDRRDETLLDRVPDSVNVTRVRAVYLRDIDVALQNLIDRTRVVWTRSLLRGLQWRLKLWWPDIAGLWALRAAWTTMWIARRERPHVVITSGPPHICHIIGFVCQKLLKIHWIMDYRDPWTAENYREQNIDEPYQHALFSRVERYFLSKTDAVVAVSPNWVSMLSSRVREKRNRFHLIRNGHDIDLSLVEKIEAERSHHNDGRCRIHFNGTIQKGSNLLHEIVVALRHLRDQEHVNTSRFRLSFCGFPDSFLIKEDISDLSDVFIDFGYLPYVESIRQCVDADALLLLVREGSPTESGVIPAKAYEQMALGKSIVALLPQMSDTRDLLRDYPLVTFSEDTKPRSIAYAFKKILCEFDQLGGNLPVLPAGDRRLYFDSHSRAHQTSQLVYLIESLVKFDESSDPPS